MWKFSKVEAPHRKEAIDKGLKRYFSGRPCSRGHIAERKVSSGNCCECVKLWRAENIDKVHEEQRLWKINNRVKFRASVKASEAKKPEKYKKMHQEWQRNNPDKVGIRVRKWNAKNPEKMLAIKRQWRADNPDKNSQHGRDRRAKMRGAAGTHSIADLARIKQFQNGMCAYQWANFPWCAKKPKRGHWDHRIAISKGGTNGPENMQWLCRACNARKFNLAEEEFFKRHSSVGNGPGWELFVSVADSYYKLDLEHVRSIVGNHQEAQFICN